MKPTDKVPYADLCRLTKQCAYDDCVAVGEVGSVVVLESFGSNSKCGFKSREDRLERALDSRSLGNQPDSQWLSMQRLCKNKSGTAILVATQSNTDGSVVVNRTADLLTAVYLPISSETSKAELRINGYLAREWRKDRNGLWSIKCLQLEEPLVGLLEEDRQILSGGENLQTMLKQNFNEIESLLASQRKTTASNPYDRGEVVEWGGRAYQRCFPMDPCVPLASLLWCSVELRFDFPCQVLLEHVYVNRDSRDELVTKNLMMRGSMVVSRPGGDRWAVRNGVTAPAFLSESNDKSAKLDDFLSEMDAKLLRKINQGRRPNS